MYRKKDFIYLLLGNDSESKYSKIRLIRKENTASGTEDFNFETIYAEEIPSAKLREILSSLPARAKKRTLVIKDPEEFSSENKEILLGYLKNPLPHNILIFDTKQYDIRDDRFLLNIAGVACVLNFQKGRRFNSFDLGRAINQGNPKLALDILSELLSEGQKPGFILGGLVSQWGKTYNKNKLLAGYEVILETDLAIKTGRLKPKLGLESLVVKLAAGFVKSFR